MKPLSEQSMKQKITDICFENGGVTKPMVDKLYNLWLQDRKAWGEYVIGTSSLSMVMSPAIRLKNGHIDTLWTDEHDKYKAAYIEDGLRAEQRQRNQGEKTDANM